MLNIGSDDVWSRSEAILFFMQYIKKKWRVNVCNDSENSTMNDAV